MKTDNANCYWVELRPLITSELKSANFTPILDALYNIAKPYRFLITNTKNKPNNERSIVRFYLQFFDEQTRTHMTHVIKALLDVEVISTIPPQTQYEVSVDLELAKNYALPITLTGSNGGGQDKGQVNLVDRLVASLAGVEGCVEITVVSDPSAVFDIQKYLHNKLYRKSGINKMIFNPVIDLAGATVGRGATEYEKENVRFKVDSWAKECIKQGELKLYGKLCTCKILIKSASLQEAQRLKAALPSAMNYFRTFKTQKNPKQQQMQPLKKPSRYSLRNKVLCQLWWITPLCTLLFAGLFGVFNPLNIISLGFSRDLVFLGLFGFFAVYLFAIFRKRQPIVLSLPELAQIIGLPTAIEKLPIALGKIPVSRMQLAHHKPKHKKQKQPTS